jgi:NarL family two-component system sensor histidine kinase LiaS
MQWQLSLSYTLVAVGALLVVELMLIGGLVILLNSELLPRLLVNSLREQFSIGLRDFLDRPTPDRNGLERYLSAYTNPDPPPTPEQEPLKTQVWTMEEAGQSLVVIDPQGMVLYTQYTAPGVQTGAPMDFAAVPGLERILPNALANAREPSQLYTRSGSMLVLAIPIEDESRSRVLGIMVFQLLMPTVTNPAFIGQLLPTILASLLLFTLFSGLVGSVFGFFTARAWTNRLGQVARAADAWSRGDFSTFIADSRDDELGALSRRLNTMAEQLQNLLQAGQDLAAMEERNRIARELHDSVKQQVFASAMQIGAARALLPDPESPPAQRLAEAERLTHQAQGELTSLIHQLRPAALEGKGLVRALRELTADWSRQTGIRAIFQAGGAQQDAPLPLPQQQALYRVTQEALANAARHSGARLVTVAYARVGETARLAVEDDGKGFDSRHVSAGVGLQSMRERVESLGGCMDVDSQVGKGARLVVTLPCADQRET